MSYHCFRGSRGSARCAIYQPPLIPLCHAGGKSHRKESHSPSVRCTNGAPRPFDLPRPRSPFFDPREPHGELARPWGYLRPGPGRSCRDLLLCEQGRFTSRGRPEKWRRLCESRRDRHRHFRWQFHQGRKGDSRRAQRQSEAITRASGARVPPGV